MYFYLSAETLMGLVRFELIPQWKQQPDWVTVNFWGQNTFEENALIWSYRLYFRLRGPACAKSLSHCRVNRINLPGKLRLGIKCNTKQWGIYLGVDTTRMDYRKNMSTNTNTDTHRDCWAGGVGSIARGWQRGERPATTIRPKSVDEGKGENLILTNHF